MKPGDKVKVVANLYRNGSQSDHVGKVGVVERVERDGFYVEFPERKTPFFFEPRELELVDKTQAQVIENLEAAKQDLETAISEMECSGRPVSPAGLVSGALGAVETALALLKGE